MAHFIWFDNDNLHYGGIGVVEYGNSLTRIIARRRPKGTNETAKNDNPPRMAALPETNGLHDLLEHTVTVECDR